jgi:hypothetical protein
MKKVKIIINFLITKNKKSKINLYIYQIILFNFLTQVIVICPKNIDLTKEILVIMVRRLLLLIMIKMVK